jgi:hypothetical protein
MIASRTDPESMGSGRPEGCQRDVSTMSLVPWHLSHYVAPHSRRGTYSFGSIARDSAVTQSLMTVVRFLAPISTSSC